LDGKIWKLLERPHLPVKKLLPHFSQS
jgi:hypothetical protein